MQGQRRKGYEYLASACLAGLNCTYCGSNNTNPRVASLFHAGKCLLVCPEIMGGLATPRPRLEIQDGDGSCVLAGSARVLDIKGHDSTKAFLKGAYMVLAAAKNYGIKKAILKSKSPSCGKGLIYNGKFCGRLISGDGVTTSLLLMHGIAVYPV